MKCEFHDNNSLDAKLEPKDKLVHEHLFFGSANCICCVTCGKYYCNKCGKLVENQNNTIAQAAANTV